MRARGTSGQYPPGTPDRTLWRRSQKIEAAPAETERFLDLAGFVDGRLDDDERERIAALIANDPLAAADAEAARTLTAAAMPAASDAIVLRAIALVDPERASGEVLVFPQRLPRPRLWPAAASWSSLAAAIALACWLGFDLGRDLPGLASFTHPSDDLGASELMETAPLALRDAPEGSSI
jgi:anti-sigma factor RsiW